MAYHNNRRHSNYYPSTSNSIAENLTEILSSHILQLNISEVNQELTVDNIYAVCNRNGCSVRKIVISDSLNDTATVHVEFKSVEEACRIQAFVHKRYMFENSCFMEAKFSRRNRLYVQHNTNRMWDFRLAKASTESYSRNYKQVESSVANGHDNSRNFDSRSTLHKDEQSSLVSTNRKRDYEQSSCGSAAKPTDKSHDDRRLSLKVKLNEVISSTNTAIVDQWKLEDTQTVSTSFVVDKSLTKGLSLSNTTEKENPSNAIPPYPVDLKPVSIPVDGNSLFSCIAFHIFGSHLLHRVARLAAVDHMKYHCTYFQNQFSNETFFTTFLQDMSQLGNSHCDELCLLALSEVYKLKIDLYILGNSKCQTYSPDRLNINESKTIALYNDGAHYIPLVLNKRSRTKIEESSAREKCPTSRSSDIQNSESEIDNHLIIVKQNSKSPKIQEIENEEVVVKYLSAQNEESKVELVDQKISNKEEVSQPVSEMSEPIANKDKTSNITGKIKQISNEDETNNITVNISDNIESSEMQAESSIQRFHTEEWLDDAVTIQKYDFHILTINVDGFTSELKQLKLRQWMSSHSVELAAVQQLSPGVSLSAEWFLKYRLISHNDTSTLFKTNRCGFIISQSLQISKYEDISPNIQVIYIRPSTNLFMCIVNANGPSETVSEAKKDEFYITLSNVITQANSHIDKPVLILLGDFNAHVGFNNVQYSHHFPEAALYHRVSNGNGIRLIQVIEKTSLLQLPVFPARYQLRQRLKMVPPISERWTWGRGAYKSQDDLVFVTPSQHMKYSLLIFGSNPNLSEHRPLMLNIKVNKEIATSVSNVQQEAATSVSNVQREAATLVSNVQREAATSVSNVQREAATSVSNVQREAATSVSNVQREAATSVNNVQQETATSVNNVQQEIATFSTEDIKLNKETLVNHVQQETATFSTSEVISMTPVKTEEPLSASDVIAKYRKLLQKSRSRNNDMK